MKEYLAVKRNRGNKMNSWCGTVLIAGMAFSLMINIGYSQSATTDEKSVEEADHGEDSPEASKPISTIRQSHAQARMLHEFVYGSLQVMHRDFFRKDEGLKIPSRSLEDVFDEMAKNHGIELRWIAVNATPMSVDHVAEDDFEKSAVKAIMMGKEEYAAVAGKQYRYAGRIPLSVTCLSCHASARSNNNERSAALIISMPLSKGNTD